MTEDEMENLAPADIKIGSVAIDEKHAYKTVVITPPISKTSPLDIPLDKINNITQKEISLGRVGVTREKAYRVIAQALDAMKWIDVSDEQGNIRREWVADIDKQRWGAEMAIKMFGDMIERREVEYDVGDKTLEKFRTMSVADLKARAADLLLGRRSAIDAEVVT